MTTSAHAHVWNDGFRSSTILKDQTSNQTFDLQDYKLQIRIKNCLQTHGTAMGTRMAPSYANLFLAKFETDALSSAPFQPFIWWRYIEDFFVTWTRSVQDLNTFTSFLNDVHSTIKFTCDYSFTSIYSRCQRKYHFTMAKSSLTFTPNLPTNTNTYYIRHVIPYKQNVLFLSV